MESFSAIPVFVAVVECGSFSLASEQLGVTKSAVSKRISQLEAKLGVQLLHRTTRKLSLTEAGERYFDYARNALTLANEGEDAISELQDRPRGRLRVNAPMAFGRLHIAPLIPDFLREHPQIEIDMMMDDKVVDLVGGSFDIAIRIGKLPDSSLIARRLAPCHSVLCASPAYLQRLGTPEKPAQLVSHNCLYYSYFQGGTEWRFNGPEGLESLVPRGNYRVNNSEALLEALLAGLGICQMPTFIVGPAIADGRLVALLPEYRLPQHAIYAMLPGRKHIPAKIRVFLDCLLTHFDETLPYWDCH
ncbi:LysR family transcriptional regulator [Shewanella sp.]|uniref:LysR family transcriptional regulator n=1 Tax=Shewanella sp. TaxID=50422 RepID=UPI002589B40F|nr:LysR family transcriptional regulator [Shewanella sp.]MCJ8304092.1 LysR substrate-binding domain-containing protein [Shewanella sp.]